MPMLYEIDVRDDGSHVPPAGSDPSWQESWYVGFYDQFRRAVFFAHVGIARVAGRADVWHWVAVDGGVVSRFQQLDLPVPEDDMSKFDIGPLHIQTTEPLRGYHVTSTDDVARVACDIQYQAFTDPFAYSLDFEGAAIGKGHYESIGRATGTITVDGKSTDVEGFAFQDHSWGPRQLGELRAHRWVYVTFGDDLFGSIMSFTSDEGSKEFGFIFDRGEFQAIVRADFNVVMANDGHSPVGCDVKLWVASGRGYRFTCPRVDVSSPSTHLDGYFVTDGFGVFESGGRLGIGIIEVNERAAPSPEHRRWLNLD
jgi:hypothetical protein